MIEELCPEEEKLEEEARGLTVQRFHKDHLKSTQDGTFSETFLGQHLLKTYLEPVTSGIGAWLTTANTGRAGRRVLSAKLLADVQPVLAAFLTIKAVLTKIGIYQEGKPPTLTAVAILTGTLIHDELRLREFERFNKKLSDRIHEDFNKRELPRYKREEYMRKAFEGQEIEWSVWSKSDRLHVGMALLDIFKDTTGDLEIVSYGPVKRRRKIVQASLGLLQAIEMSSDHCEAMFSQYMPMVVPPVDWSADNLSTGGYLTGNLRP